MLSWWRMPHNPTPYDDDFEDQPKQGWFYKWCLGIVMPVMMLAYGLRAVLTRHAVYGGRISADFYGTNALALGIAVIAAAVFVHCHYFWGNIYNQIWFAVLGKIVSAIIFIAALGAFIIRVGVLDLK